jgi:sodium/hydrogen exchanger 8
MRLKALALLLLSLLATSAFAAEGTSTESKAEEEEAVMGFGMLLLIGLLVATFLFGYVLHQLHFVYVHESGVGLILGIIVGALIRFVSDVDQLRSIVSFNQEFFFLVLLPPIIFESGYNMKRGHFFYNIDSILATALAGTLISMVVVGFLTYGVIAAGMTRFGMTILDCFIYGALISATDPVTVLAVFKALGVDSNVYANVFGESVLNDAVAIVLYRTVVGFLDAELNAGTFFLAILKFVYIFIGSIIVAVIIGLLNAILFKYTSLYKMPVMETVILVLYAYFSYLIAEGLSLSGIVAILFCGITMAHYSYNNLSKISQRSTKRFFEIIAMMAETFVFIYIGLAIFVFDQKFDIALILWQLPILLIARALNVFPMVGIVNATRKPIHRMPMTQQVMMWFSGLRGALAFSLTLHIPSGAATLIKTTTLVIVFFTVLVLGGSTVPMLKALKIKIGDSGHGPSDPESLTAQERLEAEAEEEFVQKNRFMEFDRNYLKPFFTRYLRKKNMPGNALDGHHEETPMELQVDTELEAMKHDRKPMREGEVVEDHPSASDHAKKPISVERQGLIESDDEQSNLA